MKWLTAKWFKNNWLLVVANVGSVAPLVYLIWAYYTNNLTINPIQEATFQTGKYALILLILSLACTPIYTIFGWRQVLPLRKPLGLYGFMYVTVHFFIFIWWDYGLDWGLIYEATFEKRYALVGFAAFVLLIPLAATSTKWAIKQLGRTWKQLHRLAYVAAVLGIVHYIWLVKADITEPLLWGAFLAILLGVRIPPVRKKIVSWRQGLRKRSQGAAA
ncbi:MAG: sulfoxide reductase heme-binding subunit YedZ [Okeania sp. SIO3B3]|nr:sulfoxide reductase heme-binding subunit YedZ [Okeania sp. SIO3B3]